MPSVLHKGRGTENGRNLSRESFDKRFLKDHFSVVSDDLIFYY